MYEKLLGKCHGIDPTKIQRLDNNLFIVPSQSSHGSYTVDSVTGVCTCPNGNRGAFCKHQAIIHKLFGSSMPSSPPVIPEDRHALAWLALGNKCPEAKFFLGLRDKQIEAEPNNGECSNSNNAALVQLPNESHNSASYPNEMDLSFHQVSSSDCLDSSQNLQEAKETLIKNLSSWISLQHAPTSLITDVAKEVKRAIGTPRLTGALLTLKAYLSKSRRRKIRVQPTSISRRRPGLTRGCKRVPEGRPVNARRRKKERNLEKSIQKNKTNAFSHGRGH